MFCDILSSDFVYTVFWNWVRVLQMTFRGDPNNDQVHQLSLSRYLQRKRWIPFSANWSFNAQQQYAFCFSFLSVNFADYSLYFRSIRCVFFFVMFVLKIQGKYNYASTSVPYLPQTHSNVYGTFLNSARYLNLGWLPKNWNRIACHTLY